MSEQNPPLLYWLPPRTAEAVQQHIESCQNLALILDKYVERSVIEDPKVQRRPWLQKRMRNTLDAELSRNVYQRWLLMLESLKAARFDAAVEWRMVVGLGGESVLETDITLHHLYGIPIIPGSALKGLTRAYVTAEIEEYFVSAKTSEAERQPGSEEKTDHPDIQRIFGTQKQAGSVLFFDALPANGKAEFVVDIMNPHFPDYYKSLKKNTITPPANDQSPIPLSFLAVKDATSFTFALAPRDPNDARHREDVQLVKAWLLEALQRYGVGGKTSAGYGYFQRPAAPPLDSDMKKVEGLKREIEGLKAQETAGRIYAYYQEWQPLTSQEARIVLAQAIIEQVRKAGRERASAEKGWYKELQTFLREHVPEPE